MFSTCNRKKNGQVLVDSNCIDSEYAININYDKMIEAKLIKNVLFVFEARKESYKLL